MGYFVIAFDLRVFNMIGKNLYMFNHNDIQFLHILNSVVTNFDEDDVQHRI